MKQFFKKVDMRSRKAMIAFLSGHPRYYTMNSWNREHSYSHDLKLYNVGFDNETIGKLLDMLETEEYADAMRNCCQEFAEQHNFVWQAGFNGRCSGHLVLYSGGLEPSGYKSFCKKCYQKNYKTVEESGSTRCGNCGANARVNFTNPPMNIKVNMGSIDADGDFGEWSISELRERTAIVQSFDALCDTIVAEAQYLADNFTVETEVEYIPRERLVLVENQQA